MRLTQKESSIPNENKMVFCRYFSLQRKKVDDEYITSKKGDYEYINAVMVTFSHPFLRTRSCPFSQKGWSYFRSGLIKSWKIVFQIPPKT